VTPRASYFPGEDDVRLPGSFDKLIKKLGGIDLCLSAMGGRRAHGV